MRLLILAFVLMLCVETALAGPSAAWVGNGHTYELVEQTESWTAAYAAANSKSIDSNPGYLATITSQEEQDFIFNTFSIPGLHALWIGFTDSEAYGGLESGSPANPGAPYWVWVTGEPVTYTNWVTTGNNSVPAPNNQLHTPEGEDFAELVFTNTDGTPGRWNDLPSEYFDGNNRYYLVEYNTVIPEPSSALLAAVAAFLIGGYSIRRTVGIRGKGRL